MKQFAIVTLLALSILSCKKDDPSKKNTSNLVVRNYLLTDSTFSWSSSNGGNIQSGSSGVIAINKPITISLQEVDTPNFLVFNGVTVLATIEHAGTVYHYTPKRQGYNHVWIYPYADSIMINKFRNVGMQGQYYFALRGKVQP